ncbi:MAG TPA: hypothetical protein VHW23_40060 [Kofleriaceae bacterium]|nr:hypothetical protein [Kofleriaceae bacterium]
MLPPRIFLHCAWLAVAVAGCGPQVAVRSPSGFDNLRPARWVLTYPDFAGRIEVATARDAVYVTDCGDAFVLSRVDASGRFAWQRRLGQGCLSREHAVSIAASDTGVVAAVPDRSGIRIVAFDPDGAQRWERHLTSAVRALSMAASPDRVALCITAGSDALDFEGTTLAVPTFGEVVVALDRQGARVATDILLGASDASCAYDNTHQLWLTAHFGAGPITVHGVTRSVAAGTWAVRLGDAPRFVPLYQTESTFHTVVPAGFVVYRYQESLDFIDHDGQTRWHFDLTPRRGCWLGPHAIDASPTHLLANLDVFCAERRGSARFGDVEFEDQSAPEDSIGSRDVLVELDPRTGKSRLVLDASGLPGKTSAAMNGGPSAELTYVGGSFGFIASGTFHGNLGLGTRIQSSPAVYECRDNRPIDAWVHDDYRTDSPSCRSGHHLRTEYPTWAFISAF